jgi:hypothetical protein
VIRRVTVARTGAAERVETRIEYSEAVSSNQHVRVDSTEQFDLDNLPCDTAPYRTVWCAISYRSSGIVNSKIERLQSIIMKLQRA